MSQENVEIVRRYLDEVSREPSERVGEFWETDSDYYPARKFPEARPCHGRKEIVRFITEYLAAWEDYRYLVKDARAVGDDRVLVHGRVRAEGRGSGVPAGGRHLLVLLAPAWTIHQGRGSPDREGCASRARRQWRHPRSRRPGGVGDVAGERRDRAPGAGEVEPGRSRRGFGVDGRRRCPPNGRGLAGARLFREGRSPLLF